MPNIPAHEIEHLVKAEIQKFLQDDEQLQPHLTNESIDQQKFLLEQASRLSFNDTDDERLFYHSLISRIVLSDHDITITLAGEVLVPLLKGKYWVEAHSEPSTPILLHRKVKLQPARDGSKVVVGSTSSEVTPYLAKAIIRSHQWNREILNGEVKSIKEIMKREKMEAKGYLRKILHLHFLAPDITEAILTGNHSRHLTFEQLAKTARIHCWESQRKALGF